MGGEKPFDNPKIDNCEGSPPHGRGKDALLQGHLLVLRITPAWAGKSAKPAVSKLASKDHPRMGGEKAVVDRRGAVRQGSPPHGRGKGYL